MPIGTIPRGDDIVATLTITTLEDAPVSLVGDILYFTIKVLATDPDSAALHQEIYDASANTTDHQNGVVKFQIPNSLAVGSYPYDFQWKRNNTGNGEIITLEVAAITVSQDVTLTSAAA